MNQHGAVYSTFANWLQQQRSESRLRAAPALTFAEVENLIFIGSGEAGGTAAILYTIVESHGPGKSPDSRLVN